MKKSVFAVFSIFSLCAVILIVSSGSNATGTLHPNADSQDFVPHELLVKFNEDTVGDIIQSRWLILNIISQVQGRIKTYLREEKETFDWDPSVFKNRSFHADPYLFHIRVPEEIDLDYAIARLRSNPCIEYVEKNGVARIETGDPHYSYQWGLHNSSYSGRDIHAEEAWTISTGNSEIVVAVIDTGVDLDHEDLIANLWTNPNEIPGDGNDNDENGFDDDVQGWNFMTGDSTPPLEVIEW